MSKRKSIEDQPRTWFSQNLELTIQVVCPADLRDLQHLPFSVRLENGMVKLVGVAVPTNISEPVVLLQGKNDKVKVLDLANKEEDNNDISRVEE